jgi:hypothetical protein
MKQEWLQQLWLDKQNVPEAWHMSMSGGEAGVSRSGPVLMSLRPPVEAMSWRTDDPKSAETARSGLPTPPTPPPPPPLDVS